MVPFWLPLTGLLAASLSPGEDARASAQALWLVKSRPTLAQERAPEPGPLELRREDDGLFYVDGQVNGRPVRFLVDTGASMIVLTADDARRVGAAAGREVLQVDTAKGVGSMAKVTLGSVRVGPTAAAVVPAIVADNGLSVSLLGQSWLSQMASVTIQGDRMQLR